jgi:Integrase zinc binding domain
LYSEVKGVVRYKDNLCIGSHGNWRERPLRKMYDSGFGGHSSVLSTYQKVKKLFFWSKLREAVHDYVKTCEICQMNKFENMKSSDLLQQLSILEGAWQFISMDFITGLQKSEGKIIIFMIIDKFTKYAHFLSISHHFSANDVATIFMDNIYKLHGLSLCIVSDGDVIFTSKF